MLPAGPIGALRVDERSDDNNASWRTETLPISSTPTDEGAFVSAQLSDFARSLTVETAFTVLAMARTLKAAGKDVVELEIGDSPFASTAAARAAGIDAIENNQTHYCPSPGLPGVPRGRRRVRARPEFGIPAEAENIVVGPGAKVFEQFFCEAFLDPGDGVLVFSPHFPTYVPNIERRGARAVLAPLRQANEFRPDLADVERFLADDAVAARDLPQLAAQPDRRRRDGARTCSDIADLVRGTRRRGLQRRALLPHGLEGPAPLAPGQPGMLDAVRSPPTPSASRTA